MTLYFDTSALAKLVVAESESAPHPVGVDAVSAAILLLNRIDQLDLTPQALNTAARLPPPGVRTLDALHIGSAAELADLGAVVTYDRRLAAAAAGFGLTVASPGVDGAAPS